MRSALVIIFSWILLTGINCQSGSIPGKKNDSLAFP